METLSKALVCLSAIAFILAGVGVLLSIDTIMGAVPESFSRACSNLALLSIAIVVTFGKGKRESESKTE
jgi:hypothetical protein